MRISAYEVDNQTIVGVELGEGLIRPVAEINAFWKSPSLTDVRADSGENVRLDQVKQRPAVPAHARVICIGLNYRLHAEESNQPIPEVPVIFGRWTRSLSVSGDPAPMVDEQFDWEGELGVVIGRKMFRVTPQQAEQGIFGYAAFNDLSARTFQTQTSQWTLGKNSDASGPMSAIVTADEVGNPADGLRLTTRVNGETVQDSTTSDMIFTVPELLSHISQVMTLEPGDLMITGTPSGVGIALGKFLKPGDEVEVTIERIGTVRTPIVAAQAPII